MSRPASAANPTTSITSLSSPRNRAATGSVSAPGCGGDGASAATMARNGLPPALVAAASVRLRSIPRPTRTAWISGSVSAPMSTKETRCPARAAGTGIRLAPSTATPASPAAASHVTNACVVGPAHCRSSRTTRLPRGSIARSLPMASNDRSRSPSPTVAGRSMASRSATLGNIAANRSATARPWQASEPAGTSRARRSNPSHSLAKPSLVVASKPTATTLRVDRAAIASTKCVLPIPGSPRMTTRPRPARNAVSTAATSSRRPTTARPGPPDVLATVVVTTSWTTTSPRPFNERAPTWLVAGS